MCDVTAVMSSVMLFIPLMFPSWEVGLFLPSRFSLLIQTKGGSGGAAAKNMYVFECVCVFECVSFCSMLLSKAHHGTISVYNHRASRPGGRILTATIAALFPSLCTFGSSAAEWDKSSHAEPLIISCSTRVRTRLYVTTSTFTLHPHNRTCLSWWGSNSKCDVF